MLANNSVTKMNANAKSCFQFYCIALYVMELTKI